MKSTLFTLTTLLLLSVPTLLTSPDHAVAQQHRQKQIEEDVPENALVPDPGVVSYTFRRQFSEDIPGTLDLIKEMGFSNIEFSSLFGATAEELREMLDERGLICTSYGVGYDALMYETERIIEEAQTLGASYVRVGSIPHQSPFTVEDADRAIEDFNRVGRVLSENGLTFAYHNHGFEFRPHEEGTLFDYLITESDPDHVFFEMDVFWIAHPGHDPVEYMEKYPDRFRLMHLKDLTKDAEHNFSGRAPSNYDVPLGTGQVDFPALIRAAEDSAVENYYIEDETVDVVSRVPVSRYYIQSITR